MCARRQPDDEEPRVRVAERRDWFSPVLLIGEACHALARDRLAPPHEAGAEPAADDRPLEVLELLCVRHGGGVDHGK
jgi:hypothetical protein